MRSIRNRVVSALACAMTLAAMPAVAQIANQDTVTSRIPQEFRPIGIELDELANRIGLVDDETVASKSSVLSSFLFLPKFTATTRFESNLFRAEDIERADLIGIAQPEITIRSDWANHAVRFTGNGRIGRHLDNVSENFETFNLDLTGRVDIREDLKVEPRFRFLKDQQSRSAIDDPGFAFDPVENFEWNASLRAEYGPDPFLIRTEFAARVFDFFDSPGLNNQDRDRNEFEGVLRVGYLFLPGTTVFVEPRYEFNDHELERDFAGFKQDSQIFELLAGVTWDVSGVTFIEAGVGFIRETFEDTAFETQTNPSFSLKMIWNPTDLLTFTADVDRSFEANSDPSAGSTSLTSFSNKLDYAPLENLILTLTMAYRLQEESGTDREDDDFDIGFAINYLVNEYWSLILDGGLEKRDSTLAGESYTNTYVGLRIETRL